LRPDTLEKAKNHRGFLVAAATVLLSLTMMLLVSACGDSGSSDGSATSPTVTGPLGKLTRLGPAAIEMLDDKSDVTGSENVQVRSAIDINWVRIEQQGENLTFTMDLGGPLPSAMAPSNAAEWGFILDVDGDGVPDWLLYQSNDSTNGWTAGLFNPKTKERLSGAQLPGTASHEGTDIIMTINRATIGSPQTLKWFAYTNVFVKSSTSTEPLQAGDRLPGNAAPDNSANWQVFP